MNAIAWFFGENASIDGAITAHLSAVEALPRERRAREHVRVGLLRRRAIRKPQASRASSLGRSSPMCARQITGTPALDRRGSMPGRLRIVQEHDVAGPQHRGEQRAALAAQRRS